MISQRLLIATADDFGASIEVNEAVARAFQEGILRFASLMVDGPAALDAVARARAMPTLGVGVHLVLCEEHPARWGLRLLRETAQRRRVEEVMAAQIERFLSWGLVPTHLDSHLNVHVHPAVFPALVRLARRYDIRRIRWPGGELRPSLAYDATGVPGQAALACAYAGLRLAQGWRAHGIDLVRAYGMLRSGLMDEDYLVWLIRRLPPGLTEIYLHPSQEPASAVAGRPTPTHRCVTELRGLLSPRVRQALREEGVELLTRARPVAGGPMRRSESPFPPKPAP